MDEQEPGRSSDEQSSVWRQRVLSTLTVGALVGGLVTAIGHERLWFDRGTVPDKVGEAVVGGAILTSLLAEAGYTWFDDVLLDNRKVKPPHNDNSVTTPTDTAPNPTPSNTVPPATATPKAELSLAEESGCINKNMSIEDRVGALMIVGIGGDALSGAASTYKRFGIGGVLVQTAPADPNDGSLNRFKKNAGNPMAWTDEEGGEVQRYSSLGVLASEEKIAQTKSLSEVRYMFAEHGKLMKATGVDGTFGPVVDLRGKGALGSRAYGDDQVKSSQLANATAQGWKDAKMVSTYKHLFGSAMDRNTDNGVGLSPSIDELRANHMMPYAKAPNGVAFMMANTIVPGLTDGHKDDSSDDVPASLSPDAVREVRDRMKFNGTLITDALNADAITLQLAQQGVEAPEAQAEAAARAIGAGVDQVIIIPRAGNTALKAEISKSLTKSHRQPPSTLVNFPS